VPIVFLAQTLLLETRWKIALESAVSVLDRRTANRRDSLIDAARFENDRSVGVQKIYKFGELPQPAILEIRLDF
jgi:hypothetical protein